MTHPRTACSTSSSNLCAQCAPLYTPLAGHIPSEKLNCPTPTTYPIILKIRIRPATTPAEAQETHSIPRAIARVLAPQVQNMFKRGMSRYSDKESSRTQDAGKGLIQLIPKESFMP
ncbi:hypothetical protein BJX65DRAFT_301949 [Aspergillus insuetus]